MIDMDATSMCGCGHCDILHFLGLGRCEMKGCECRKFTVKGQAKNAREGDGLS